MEPKRCYAYDKAVSDERNFERDVELIRADDPAYLLRDRAYKAMDALVEICKKHDVAVMSDFTMEMAGFVVLPIPTADVPVNTKWFPDLLSAIESIPEGGKE